ncbi:MAG: tetratricopeptide repeat protein [Rhodospirillales bacterium]|nr:tetratricopeptide repeat protein [Rhodospirillales bacterium]
MIADRRGLALTTASAAAARHYDAAVSHYVKYRISTGQWVRQMLDADPDFVMGHCFKGYLALTGYNAATLPRVADSIVAATAGLARVTPRERLHVAALAAWHRGAVDEALAAWERILADHPGDLMALRLAHFNYFWAGQAPPMRESVARVAPAWRPDTPDIEAFLAMRAFASEECGEYAAAERDARRAVEIDPTEVWGTHALAHVMEMQGRHRDGIAWLAAQEPNWADTNNMVHHLWWHWALFHLELGEIDAVLALYDEKIRNPASPLYQAQPDLYIDVQNAASLLWRLERAGAAVGDRWTELAEKAARRIGDCQSPFTLPHFMMALAARGDAATAARFLDGLRAYAAAGKGSLAPVVGAVAVPACEAAAAHRRGEHTRVVALLVPLRGELWRLGGSHAQRDFLTQMLVDAAAKSGRADIVRDVLADEAKARPVDPARRAGYAAAARLAMAN